VAFGAMDPVKGKKLEAGNLPAYGSHALRDRRLPPC